MNITQQMNDLENMNTKQAIKDQLEYQILDLSDDTFFEAYYDNTIESHIKKGLLFEQVADILNMGDGEVEQAFLYASIDQVLDSDWFISYIEEQADGRQGELDKQSTDQQAFTVEKNIITTKNG